MPEINQEVDCQSHGVSRIRIYIRIFLTFFFMLSVLVLLLTVFPALGKLKDLYTAIWLIAVLAALQIYVWPLVVHSVLNLFHKISPLIMLITFPLIYLVLPALLLLLADWLSPGITINGFGAVLLIALIMAIITLIFMSLFSADDESAIFRWILKRNRASAVPQEQSNPGIIFLEIDGLGGRVLKDAIALGKAPNLKRWLDCGSHKMVFWESDLSSQTSAAQAGILHGNNFGIPAFRWFDKAKKEVIVSSSIKDVAQIEKQISDGRGLMNRGGATRGSLLSGDATRVFMTASRVLDVTSEDLQSYFLDPTNLLKTCCLIVWDWCLEKKAAWSQVLKNEKPRVNRGGIYFILRSFMTILLRDFSLFTVKGDMYAGVPYAYVTLAGYDEVSHHSGMKRPDTLEVLRKLDREFGKLERIASDAPRKYRLVVLSDHGHAQGATFKDRYKESLEDVVGRLIQTPGKEYNVAAYRTQHESAYYIDAAFRDYKFSGSSAGKRLRGVLIKNQQHKTSQGEQEDVIVLSSGNLGLIYFPGKPGRVSLEEITQGFPELLPGLINHPGIGFIMVRSAEKGTIILGKKGKVFLSTGQTEGENPLTIYGPQTLNNLARSDSFPNFPDILVNSTYWQDTDEIAAFEELVASHGGVGGEQSRPFILYPAEFDLGADRILGAEVVYRIFKRWISKANLP